MKPFIVKTIQLRDLTLKELQQVWDKLITTEGTQIHETIKDLDPQNPNSCDIEVFDYLGVLESDNGTFFTDYSSKLKGEIIDISKILEIPTYVSMLVNKVPHVHEKLIKEWAEGAQIQQKVTSNNTWEDCHPLWNDNVQYRIKPKGTFSSLIILENTGEYDSCDLESILGQYYPEAEIHIDIDEQNIILKFNGLINLEEILGNLPELYITFKSMNVVFN